MALLRPDERGELEHLAAMCGIRFAFCDTLLDLRRAVEAQKKQFASHTDQHLERLSAYLRRFE